MGMFDALRFLDQRDAARQAGQPDPVATGPGTAAELSQRNAYQQYLMDAMTSGQTPLSQEQWLNQKKAEAEALRSMTPSQ